MANKHLVDRIGDRKVIASISGGKDSAAMSLYLRELGIDHELVFMDTGWEHPDTYAYLRYILPNVLGPIRWLRAPRQMEELIIHKGMFPSRIRRFCTDELKVKPLQKHLRACMDDGHDVLNVVGIRAEESDARSRLPEWEWQEGFDCEVWRPILRWTLDDVIAIHRRHNLTPNPLYLRGVKRVGCWPCINCSKSEIRFMAESDPHRVVRLRVLENHAGDVARNRHDDRMKTHRSALTRWRSMTIDEKINMRAEGGRPKAGPGPFHRPAWFQCPTGEKTAEGKRSGACWPIDKVVEWSKTIRGGKEEDRQELLFANMNDGCMRWGLCDTESGK